MSFNEQLFNELDLLSNKLNIILKNQSLQLNYDLLTERSDDDLELFVNITTAEIFVKKELIKDDCLVHSFLLAKAPFYIGSLVSQYEEYLTLYVSCIKQQHTIFLKDEQFNQFIDIFTDFHALLSKSLSNFN